MCPNPAAVTMALLSGSLTWSATSKMRHMNPEWRSLMRKKCPISPLISPWKTRSIEMGNTGMTSKWTEFALMYSNWNKFLQSAFFLFHFSSTWTSLLFFWTLNINLSSPRGSFWQMKYHFNPFFPPALPLPLTSAEPRGCLWGVLLPAALCWDQGSKCPPGCAGQPWMQRWLLFP